MIAYLAGWQASTTENETRLIKAGVITHRCFSFANMVKIPGLPFFLPGTEQGYQACMKHKVGIMMDSGVFSYRTHRKYLQRTGKSLASLPTEDDYVRMYVEFCKTYHTKWDFYVTIDIDVISKENFQRHKVLESMGIRPMPVVHGDDCIDTYIRKYVDRGYTYICLGTSRKLRNSQSQKRRYYDAAFNAGAKFGAEFHGLAATAPWIMLGYPWRSVDSSSWSRAAGYGSIMRFDEVTGRVGCLHVSERSAEVSQIHFNTKVIASIKKEVEAEGYDFKELRTSHIARHQYNAATMLKIVREAERRHGKGQWSTLV